MTTCMHMYFRGDMEACCRLQLHATAGMFVMMGLQRSYHAMHNVCKHSAEHQHICTLISLHDVVRHPQGVGPGVASRQFEPSRKMPEVKVCTHAWDHACVGIMHAREHTARSCNW